MMQTSEWKRELADILAEDDERQAASNAGPDTWGALAYTIGRLEDWIGAGPAPKSAKGQRRRAELLHIVKRLNGVLEDL